MPDDPCRLPRVLLEGRPAARALLRGSDAHPFLRGEALFYPWQGGSLLLVRAVGTYQAVDDNLVDNMEPILTLEENGVYAYYPAGGETFYHSGWYTVDDRVITLEDTQGNLRTAIYVNGTIYLVEGDGVVSVVHRMRQNAEYENISIDTLPSPRT